MNICRDKCGNISLECTCGLVLSGNVDKTQPYGTAFGSIWTNNSPDFLKIPHHEDPRENPRNRCIHDGYVSVALIPIKAEDEIIGLLQLNDKRKGRFSEASISFLEDLCSILGGTIKRRQIEADLGERNKELNCIFKISKIIEMHNNDIDKALSDIVEVMPKAWRFPNNCAINILYANKVHANNLSRANHSLDSASHSPRQEASLTLNGDKVGYIRVEYLDLIDYVPETVFLKEEWNLLSEVVILIESAIRSENLSNKIINENHTLNMTVNQLHKSEESFRTLVTSLPDIIIRADLDFKFLYISPIILKYLDIELDSLIGKTSWESGFPGDFCEFFDKHLRLVVQTESPHETEFEMESKFGKTTFNLRVNPEFDNGGKLVSLLILYRDITSTKQSIHELEETKAILQAAMDCSPAGIAIADAPDGKLRYVNNAGLGIRQSCIQDLVDEIGIDEYVSAWKLYDLNGNKLANDEVPLARAIMYGEKCAKEMVIHRADNTEHVVFAIASPICNDQGEVISAVVVFPDITDIKLAQKEAQQAKNKFSKMFHCNPNTLLLIKYSNGLIIDINNRCTSMFGIEKRRCSWAYNTYTRYVGESQ